MGMRLKSASEGSEQPEHHKQELNRLVDRVGWGDGWCSIAGLAATRWEHSCPCHKTEGGWRVPTSSALVGGCLPALKGSSAGFSALLLS
jgi:hypothetical protein